MDFVYITLLYTPVLLTIILGFVAMTSDSKVIQSLAFFVPTAVVAITALAVMETLPTEMDVVDDILKLQCFFLIVVALIFMVIQVAIRPMLRTLSQRRRVGTA